MATTLSIDLTLNRTLSFPSISPHLSLPPPVLSVHFSIEAFRWMIAVETTLRGVYEMRGIGSLLHQSSRAFEDVSTPVFDRVLVIVIPSHILESLSFPLPESLIIWHGSHEFLHAIPILEAWETQSGVFFLRHIVIVCVHAHLLHATLHIFVRFMRNTWVGGIVLLVPVKATLSSLAWV